MDESERLQAGLGAVGFVGLGNMGSALAANLVAGDFAVHGHDAAGPGRAPAGVRFAESVDAIARAADVAVLSLPDADACEAVVDALAGARESRLRCVVDTSTIGVAAARIIGERLAAAGIGFVDAPVSGGPAGARARTLAIMFAGSEADCACAERVLAGLSDRRFRVGDRPGLGQAMKLANNFLSATALAATSEAVAFGGSLGLEMETMLEVLTASSGRNTAVSEKFPAHVLTGRFASGFRNTLMAKDLRLYLESVTDASAPHAIGALTAEIWERFAAAEPDADFTRIYPHIRSSS